MDQLFNNREIAVLVWAIIFLSWAFTKEEVRKSVRQVLLAFCHRAILTIFGLMTGYVYLMVDFLSDAGLWDLDQFKNTIKWFIFVASIELFKANTIHEEKGYFRKSIKGHFKLLALLEFVIAFQTFNLITEFIVVPLSTLAVLLLAFSESKEEYKSVENLMSWVLFIIGFFMIWFSLYFIFSNFGEFAETKTFMNFFTPIMLSVLLLPFIFVLSVYMLYERILVRVNIYTEDRFYRFYAKLKGLKHFKRNHKDLNDWLLFSCRSDFKTRKTIDDSIISFETNNNEMV
jgi:multisubunit Na+/H+ antiporter MnhB subunit